MDIIHTLLEKEKKKTTLTWASILTVTLSVSLTRASMAQYFELITPITSTTTTVVFSIFKSTLSTLNSSLRSPSLSLFLSVLPHSQRDWESMGASLSNLADGLSSLDLSSGLGDILESCVAYMFLYLTQPEICNLARLNCVFRSAASLDSVWEAKLPANYQDLLDLLPPERYKSLSKKDIFDLISIKEKKKKRTRCIWFQSYWLVFCFLR